MVIVWPGFLARVKPVSTSAKAGLHEHHQKSGDQRPDEIDRRGVGAVWVATESILALAAPALTARSGDVANR